MNNMLIFKVVEKGNVVTGTSTETEENLRKVLFDRGYFIFLIRKPMKEEEEYLKSLMP